MESWRQELSDLVLPAEILLSVVAVVLLVLVALGRRGLFEFKPLRGCGSWWCR